MSRRVIDDGCISAKKIEECYKYKKLQTNLNEIDAPRFAVPLCRSSGRCVHCKLPHGALLQVLLLPLGDVGLQGQNALLFLPQLLLQRGAARF